MSDASQLLETLYTEQGPGLLAYLRSRHQDPATAEDLLHDTFHEAARRPERIELSASPRGYLFGIARNLSRKRRQRARFEPIAADGLAVAAAEADKPDERGAQVVERLKSLSAQDREILEFRLRDGLAYAEIAEALGIPIGTVRSRIHSAIIRLRRAIYDDDHAHCP